MGTGAVLFGTANLQPTAADITARDALIPQLTKGDIVPVADSGSGDPAVYQFDGVGFLPISEDAINQDVLDAITNAGSGEIITSAERAGLHAHLNKIILDSLSDAGSGQVITAVERSGLHTHANKSIIDAITNAGSGAIITLLERAKLAALPLPYALIQDEKSAGTDGGTFTKNGWRTRDLNIIKNDSQSVVVSVSANRIILQAGTYHCRIRCPAFKIKNHKARLRNITASTTLLLGSTAFAEDKGMTDSYIVGEFAVAAAQQLEIQHYSEDDENDDGFGVGFNIAGTVETYTQIELWELIL